MPVRGKQMADANNEAVNEGADAPGSNDAGGNGDSQQNSQPRFKSLDDAVAELTKLEKNLERSRQEEKYAKAKLKELKDASSGAEELQAKFEAAEQKSKALEQRIRNRVIDEALNKALTDAKAKSLSTVMKLINRDEIAVGDDDVVDTKSVEAVIGKLKKEDPILFEVVEAPDAKRPAEGAVAGGYEKELKSAKSVNEIEAVLKKYGKQ
jgi:DNA repair exonuclease SbcCD ATPase subunit